jgi:hypothetical protein
MNNPVAPANALRQISAREHQRQIFWQVWIPLSLGILLVLTLAALTIIGANRGSVTVTKWSHFSLVLIVIPPLFIGLIILAFLCGAVYGVAKSLKIIPAYTGLVKAYAQLISSTIKVRSDKFLQPIFTIRGWLAAMNRFWLIVRGKNPA